MAVFIMIIHERLSREKMRNLFSEQIFSHHYNHLTIQFLTHLHSLIQLF